MMLYTGIEGDMSMLLDITCMCQGSSRMTFASLGNRPENSRCE